MDIETTRFCAIDIETTGLNPKTDEIIAFASIPILNMKILVRDAYYTLIKPEQYRIGAMKYHGISPGDLFNAPKFEDIASGLLEGLDGVLIGHSVHFDFDFLKRKFKSVGIKFKRDYLDIVLIERWLRQKRQITDMDLCFDAMMSYYGLKEFYRHNASADAFHSAQIFQIQMKEMVAFGMDTLKKVRRATSVCQVPEYAYW